MYTMYIVCCIVLYCIILYCIVLYYITLYCIALHCIVLYCIVLDNAHIVLANCGQDEQFKSTESSNDSWGFQILISIPIQLST